MAKCENATRVTARRKNRPGNRDRDAHEISPPFDLLKEELGVFVGLCEAVATPRALACKLLVESGEYKQLVDLPAPERDPWVNPGFADDYLVTEALRKNPRLPLGINRRRVAGLAWCAAERRNRQTNTFIRAFPWHENNRLARVVNHARRLIARVLGPADERLIEYVLDRSRHGPGATSTVRGADISAATKNITSMGVTPGLWPVRGGVTPLWQDDTVGFVEQDWDTWINVPKNAKTDRGICIGPALAVYLQLGVGEVIREKLKASGLDIRRAQGRHRYLVRVAKKLGLATIDLSSASDSICIELVRLLLPRGWFNLLDKMRVAHTRIYGKTVHLAKFAAMGNGYTFELETLIFWALARSVCELRTDASKGPPESDPNLRRFVSCYGDDIIVPQDCAGELIKVLDKLGFSTNDKKTFLAGSFFESCGSDVWCGEDVRPLYLDHDPRDKTEWCILVANAIRLYALRRGMGVGCDKRFLHTWLNVVKKDRTAKSTGMPVSWEQRELNPSQVWPDVVAQLVRSKLPWPGETAFHRNLWFRHVQLQERSEYIPSVSAASGIIRNFDEARPKLLSQISERRNGRYAGWEGYLGRMWYHRPKIFRSKDTLYTVGCYIVALQSGSMENTRNTEYARKATHKGRLKSTICPTWTDIGPWVDLHGRRG